jgi:hypothetical protein
MRALPGYKWETVNTSRRRESDMPVGAILEVPEHEFDDDDWDDPEEVDADELDVDLDEENIQPEEDNDF